MEYGWTVCDAEFQDEHEVGEINTFNTFKCEKEERSGYMDFFIVGNIDHDIVQPWIVSVYFKFSGVREFKRALGRQYQADRFWSFYVSFSFPFIFWFSVW